jgi:hypothetical protein
MHNHHLDDVEALPASVFQVLLCLFAGQPRQQQPPGIAQPKEWLTPFRHQKMSIRSHPQTGQTVCHKGGPFPVWKQQENGYAYRY